ncbi:hypothetical protein LPB41_02380 [Thalassospira sp. MA62]|nr:hypothetical protein [Thalassospira sp. MA62]
MMSDLQKFGVCALLIGSLAACGDLPRPFQGAGRMGDPELLELRDTSTVRVEGGEDLPDGAATHLARAMARALRQRDIPAYSDSDQGGDYILRPNIQARLLDDGADLDITWVLMRADGLAVDTSRASGEIASKQWFADAPQGPEEDGLPVPPELADKVRELSGKPVDKMARTYDALVAQSADDIAFVISGDRSALQAAPIMQVALVDFAGAPGDGNAALARSAGALLKARGITVENKDIGDNSVILSATIDVRPLEDERAQQPLDQVSIEWVIMDPDGAELGQMAQNNVVPRGSLNERWGPIASLAAQAAVDTLDGVLSQIASSRKLRLHDDRKPGVSDVGF